MKKYRSILPVILLILTPSFLFSLDMVSILDFRAEGGISEYESNVLRAVFEAELIDSGMFQVIEKTEQEAVINAQKDTLQGCVDDVCAVEIGRLLAADKILTGVVAKFGSRFILTVKILDIETGRSLRAKNIQAAHIEGLLDSIGSLVLELAGVSELEIRVEVPEGYVFVKGGTFLMGSSDNEEAERPVHSVTVDDFIISKYEVTQEQWEDVTGYSIAKWMDIWNDQLHKSYPNLSHNPEEGDNLPMSYVDFVEAVNFCNLLSEKEGFEPVYDIDVSNGIRVTYNSNKNGYRLPTEAEWEYAACGGNRSMGYIYSGSDDIDAVAWHGYREGGVDGINPVGSKKPNELGIFDMSGNVGEWCWDLYQPYGSAKADSPLLSYDSMRIYRGAASFTQSMNSCRVTYRGRSPAGVGWKYNGLRVVRSLE